MADTNRLEKLNNDILNKEEELARSRREYLGEKTVHQEILEILQSIPAKDIPGDSNIMMCPTDDIIQDFPEIFGK